MKVFYCCIPVVLSSIGALVSVDRTRRGSDMLGRAEEMEEENLRREDRLMIEHLRQQGIEVIVDPSKLVGHF